MEENKMPRGDGTGPIDRSFGKGRGRMKGNKQGAGISGYCICPSCGCKVEHQQGTPCSSIICPSCGQMMRRG